MDNVADIFSIYDDRFSLCGVGLFEPPVENIHLGHYKAAIKFRQGWTVYDDLKTAPTSINAKKHVIVASFLYVKV